MLFSKIEQKIKESGIIPSYSARKKVAARYISGEGIEIGALHHPLPVSPNVKVKYVDYATREENIRRFPEIDAAKVVNTDYIDDGFTLACIPPASQDFVIANHVLTRFRCS